MNSSRNNFFYSCEHVPVFSIWGATCKYQPLGLVDWQLPDIRRDGGAGAGEGCPRHPLAWYQPGADGNSTQGENFFFFRRESKGVRAERLFSFVGVYCLHVQGLWFQCVLEAFVSLAKV